MIKINKKVRIDRDSDRRDKQRKERETEKDRAE